MKWICSQPKPILFTVTEKKSVTMNRGQVFAKDFEKLELKGTSEHLRIGKGIFGVGHLANGRI